MIDLPLEIVQIILENVCENELFEQANNPYLKFALIRSLRKAQKGTTPQPRELKPFASVAYRVCRSWRKIVQTSSTFWVARHPSITPDTRSLSAEQGCDLDFHYNHNYRRGEAHTNMLDQFEKYLFPLLPRVRVLILAVEGPVVAGAVMDYLAQAHLPRLRFVQLSLCPRDGWIPRISIKAPGLYHLNLSGIGSSGGITQAKGLLSLGLNFPFRVGDGVDPPNMNLVASHLQASSMTLTILNISLDRCKFDSSTMDMDAVFMPSLTELRFSGPTSCMLECMEIFKIPGLRILCVDMFSLTPMWHGAPEYDSNVPKFASPGQMARTFDIPAIKELSIYAPPEVFPYIFSLLSESDLLKIEKVSLRFSSYYHGPSSPGPIPFKDTVRFPNLRELAIGLTTQLDQTNWCLRFFDLSTVTDKVTISSESIVIGDRMEETMFEFPHLKRVCAEGIIDLSRVIVPSVRHVELIRNPCRPFMEREETKSVFSRAFSQVESLHLGRVTRISDPFEDGRICRLFPGIRTLALDLYPETQNKTRRSARPPIPISIPPRFPKLETLKLISLSPDHVRRGIISIIKQISCFNHPCAQIIRRVELHGWRNFLDAAEPVVRKSLLPDVEICLVEIVTPLIHREQFGRSI